MNERSFIIRAVVAFYASGIGLFAGDLMSCEIRNPGTCDNSRGRLEGAVTAAPAALLAILVRSTPPEK
jgi:hypothetical protein